jgi:hypothetical protein
MLERFLSFDCGLKTIAIADISVDWEISKTMSDFFENSRLGDIPKFAILHRLQVIDLIPGILVSKCGPNKLARALKKYLNELKLPDCKFKVIIERQKSVNRKSSAVQCQLAYHFCDIAEDVIEIYASCKNKIFFGLEVDDFLTGPEKTESRKYAARKKHAIYNAGIIIPMLENGSDLYNSIKPGLRSHVADAVCQMWYYSSNHYKHTL